MAHVSSRDQQQRIEWLGGSHRTVLLDAAATGGALSVVVTDLRAGDASPVHVRSAEDEGFVLLAGSAVVRSGETRHQVGGGGIEEFFRAAGHDLSHPRPDGFAVTPATRASAAQAVGITLLGPPRTD